MLQENLIKKIHTVKIRPELEAYGTNLTKYIIEMFY